MLSRVIENKFCCNLDNGNMLRKITMKISLERINMCEGLIVEALLDSRRTELVISLKFARKQEFKLKKNKKIDICEEFGQFLQQGGTY